MPARLNCISNRHVVPALVVMFADVKGLMQIADEMDKKFYRANPVLAGHVRVLDLMFKLVDFGDDAVPAGTVRNHVHSRLFKLHIDKVPRCGFTMPLGSEDVGPYRRPKQIIVGYRCRYRWRAGLKPSWQHPGEGSGGR